MRLKYTITSISIIVLVLMGCSTKKNTWLSRNFQSLVSHYNVYFNGNESFNKGLLTISQTNKNDYSHILPVYEFADDEIAKSGSSDMDVALEKAHKLIQLHSISVKPKRKSGVLTDKQKRFMTQKEFNPYVDDAYALIVKANTVKHEDEEAINVAEYLVREYAGEPSCYEARIWMAIAYSQLKQYVNAQSILEGYDLDGLAPANLYGQFMAAYANILLEQKKYAEALPYMENAAKEAGSKHQKLRYTYIVAQIYRLLGRNDKAAPIFLALSRNIHNYDMAFAAKLDLAIVASTPEELAAAEKVLEKMRTDAKNAEQLDQIYYSLGQINMHRGIKPKAVECYNLSIEKSVSNDNQKGLSFLALADIYIDEPKYIEASESFDSAATFLNDANPRYAEAQQKSAQLSGLADNLRTIRNNDSLLMVANMPAKQRDKIIDEILDRQQEELRRKAAFKETEMNLISSGLTQTEVNNIQRSAGASSQWYFYNRTIVDAGRSAFIRKWGKRRDEDNWRRADKRSNSDDGGLSMGEGDMEDLFSESRKENDEEKLGLGGDKGIAPTKNTSDGTTVETRETLLAKLPLSAERQKESNLQIEQSLFASGDILCNQLADYKSAAKQFETLLQRYPQSALRYQTMVALYQTYQKSNDNAAMQQLRPMIINSYSQSAFADYLQNPSFFADREMAYKAREERYEQTYNEYLNGNYSSVSSMATSALADTSDAYPAKYLLLRSLAAAKQGQVSPFRADLMTITQKYAGSEEDSLAKIFLAQIENGRQPVKAAPYKSPLVTANSATATANEENRSDFVYNADTTHTVLCLVETEYVNKLIYRIADYNFSSYLVADYDIQKKMLTNGKTIVTISGFANKTEAQTYFYSLRDQKLWSDVTGNSLPNIVVVSNNNLRTVLLLGSFDAYMNFFEQYYLNRNVH